MGLVALVSNTQTSFPIEIISQGGALATISLMIFLTIELLILDTKYWNKWVSGNLDSSSGTLLVLFVAIVVFNIIVVL
ncbi:MAG: hypothetical protein C3F06_05855 [Candidatus Methanoperedenaceae archaeon]|nr:MAG: hypothetical protein C3F06_05855 [Candidatus Methanoperedenaceae archaeon]